MSYNTGYGDRPRDEYGSDPSRGGYAYGDRPTAGGSSEYRSSGGGDEYGADRGGYAYGASSYTSEAGSGRRPDNSLYGGGGSAGGNYYDRSERFDDGGGYGTGNSGGGGGGYGGSTGTSYGGGGAHGGDLDNAKGNASSYAEGSGDDSLFGSALAMLGGRKQSLREEDVDEDDAVRQHKRFYGDEAGGHEAGSGALGTAAAMQALKMVSGGHGKGGSQGEFIGMAMGQAAKLFDQQSAQGKTHPQATKQDAVASAAQMAFKMYMKSEMGGGSHGGGSSGGGAASGLLNMASKFLSR
ncbi:hypothetical protein BDY21DRAFT_358461 [Lineolata rhizophorae]|uniref:DUF7721 domain-containing protein n=1 Tax=Lineolata rhizophorae TaxID=578093 RepID=A0A6A6NLY3_9PEZI|nr:hypothetical protein BDY21DRAFT_358461 [Lineolata rhizophorae]